jgi:hypothetical protein
VVGGGVSEASEHGNSYSADSPQDRLRRRVAAIGHTAIVGPTKVGGVIDFGRVFNRGRAAYA